MSSIFLGTALFVFAFLTTNFSYAGVSVYQLESQKNEPTIVQEDVLGSVASPHHLIPQLKGILKKSGYVFGNFTELSFLSIKETSGGFALKYAMTYKNIPIDGNILVATFDRHSKLQSITHDLPGAEIQQMEQAILKDEAYKMAKTQIEGFFKALNMAVPSAIENAYLIVVKNKKLERTLAWRLRIGFLLVDIDASGENQGEVINVAKTIQDADTEVLLSSLSVMSLNGALQGQFHGGLVSKNQSLTNEGQILSLFQSDLVRNQMSETEKLFRETLNVYFNMFGLRGYDGQDQRVSIVFLPDLSTNAFWNGQIFGMAVNSEDVRGLSQAPDVIGHEFTHAVIQYSSNLTYIGQSGALNESLADVFGEYIQMKNGHIKTPWKIGESIQGPLFFKALRDFRNPKNGISAQPEHMQDLTTPEFSKFAPNHCNSNQQNDNCGVHTLSGITNRAFALVVDAIGWESAISIYYRVMTLRLHPSSDFRNFRNHVIDECLLQQDKIACDAVSAAFSQVGL